MIHCSTIENPWDTSLYLQHSRRIAFVSEVAVTSHMLRVLGFYCASTQSTGTTQLLVFYTLAGVGPTEQSVIQSLAYRIQIRLAVWERHSRQKSWRAFAEIGKSPSHPPQLNPTPPLPTFCVIHPLSSSFRFSVIMSSRYIGYDTIEQKVWRNKMMLTPNYRSFISSK